MSLPVGLRLGSYEIESQLGSGGMGTVYRARDRRLGRLVAVKVLRDDVAGDTAVADRLEQEARLAAALNHPHVCTIHDIGRQDGHLFLVMELVEGITLATRLETERRRLPIADSLEIASQVAEALAAAHRVGIVHRDVKPANIMITKGGIKLLDFGVARLRWRDGASANALTAMANDSADMAGTLIYMAPEQLAGHADARTDIFALGCVLFEMLAGRRAYSADSRPLLLAAIAEAAVPSVTAFRPEIPPALTRTLSRCLAKEPEQRWQSASDLADELRWIGSNEAATAEPAASGDVIRHDRSARWWLVAAVVAVALISAGYGMRSLRPSAAAPVYVDDLELPPGTSHWAGLAISPDGRHVALVTQPARPETRDPRLWMREIGSAEGWVLLSGQGDETPRYPFWSPDGRSLGYFVDGHLVRVNLPTLTPVPLWPAPDPRGAAWLDDGTIVFAPDPGTGLWKGAAAGGAASMLLDRGPGEIGLKFPVRVGVNRLIYWSQHDDPAKSQELMLDLGREIKPVPIVPTARAAAFDADTLFYWRGNVLLGQRLDQTGTLLGEGEPIAVDTPAPAVNSGTPGVSAGGGHVAVANVLDETNQLTWVNRDGSVAGILSEPLPHTAPDISADGRHVVVERFMPGRGSTSLWSIDLETTATRELTSSGDASSPIWSPDGTRILFRSFRGIGGNSNLYQLNVDNPTQIDPAVEGRAFVRPSGWLPGGNGVAFHSTTEQNQAIVPFPAGLLFKRGEAITPFRRIGGVRDSRLSPDGSKIAWVTGDTIADVFVDTFPIPANRPVQVSRGGGSSPRWRADGRELYFLSGSQMMAVPFQSGMSAGRAERLFTLPAGDDIAERYAVSPDGMRFLIAVPTSREAATVKVSMNWRASRATP